MDDQETVSTLEIEEMKRILEIEEMQRIPEIEEMKRIPEIEEKKALLGSKESYHFKGKKFNSREEAEAARRAEFRRCHDTTLAKYEESKKLAAQQEVFTKYDEAPEYNSWFVATEPVTDKKDVWGGLLGQKETGLAAIVNLPALNDRIYQACRDISLRGYEVVSIVPVESGVGAYNFPGGKVVGGAGWGYSFTQGVTILGRRKT